METLLLSAVTLSATLALFVALYKLVRYETKLGDRVFLRGIRSLFDRGLDWCSNSINDFVRSLQSNFHRAKQKQTDRNLSNALIRHATHTPLTVTHTNNHLSQIRDHKSEVALTPAQGKKLRHKKLEERF